MTKSAAFLATAVAVAAGFAVLPAPAEAQGGARGIMEVIVYGDDPCPRSSDDEIVVCARRPESERYRIPETLRTGGPRQERQAWVNTARSLETVSDTGIYSCSPVGPAGYTGCLEQLIRQSSRQRREAVEEDTAPEL